MVLGLRARTLLSSLLALALWLSPVFPGHAQVTTDTRGIKDTTESASAAVATGKYYALVIGISRYQHLPALVTPENDAREIANVLTTAYGFQTRLLLDADRDQVLRAIEQYLTLTKEPDSLLIYYAGHGHYDEMMDQAYWAPVDATEDSYVRWITANDVTARIRAIPARHVLIVSDSCYSGMMARDVDVRLASPSAGRTNYLSKILHGKSRNLLASGGKEPVADGDAPGHLSEHSVFANVLLHELETFRMDAFTTEELFVALREEVAGRSRQTPEYDAIQNSNHTGGDFVFLRTGNSLPTTIETASHEVIEPLRADPDKDALGTALDNYERAYASMDIRELRKVWPSLSKGQEKEIRDGFAAPDLKAVQVQLRNRTLKVSGQTATADCDQWMIYTFAGRRQPPQTSAVEIQLAKNNHGDWAINAVKAR